MKRIREYLKGKNPYMLASVAVVILSIGLIGALLWDTPSAESSMEGSVETQESEVQTEEVWETEEITEVFEETQQTEETVFENPEETAEESDPVSEEICESGSATEESQEETESTEASTEPETEESPEEVPDLTPEKGHDEDQETVPKEETEEQPEEEVIPGPEERPEPEVHEHSWIFESYYQEPTCSNGGLVTQICAKCGETQITGGTPTGEHSYEVETEGDCCSAEVVVCTECNFREVREKNPDNHIDVEDGFCYGCGQQTE